MQQHKLNKDDYEQWRRENWQEYASCTVDGARLIWKTNKLGAIVVTHGGKELYRGFATDLALQAWESA